MIICWALKGNWGKIIELQKQALKLVFSNSKFVILSIVISIGMFIPLIILLQFLFVAPLFFFQVLNSEVFSFSLVVIISALTGLVLSMGIYRIHILRATKRKLSSGVFGSIIGIGTGACGCISINVALVPILVPIAGAVAFFEAYTIPLRLISIAILGLTYYVTVKGITSECKIKPKKSLQFS